MAGEPLISRILSWLARSGIEDVLLNLHHRPETITAIVGTGGQFGLHVRYSWEDPILGSAGGPRRAFSLIADDELLLVNGDTLADPDLGALVQAHRSSGALVTLAAAEHPIADRYGGIRADGRGWYAGPAGRGQGLHFVGVQVVRRDALAGIEDGQAATSIGGVYERVAAARPGSVRVFETRASFLDIGTPATYLAACLALGADVSAGARCRIAPSSQLSRSVLWDDVVIEEGAMLRECIVCDGVTVPRGSRYHRAVLLRPGDAPHHGDERVEHGIHLVPLGTI